MTDQQTNPPVVADAEIKPQTQQWNSREEMCCPYSKEAHLAAIARTERHMDCRMKAGGYAKCSILTRTLTITEGKGFDILTVWLLSEPVSTFDD